jgi:pimeloyl-ACP methyl ester carboxylesterase
MTDPLDHPLVSRRVFQPRPTAATPSLWVDTDGGRLGCHVRRVDPAAGWVVYFHGNGELAADCDRHLHDLFTGVNVCFAEYRGYGASDGTPQLAAMLGDGERVVAALGVPAEWVVAFGRSLGSVYAVELARRLPALAGLILESGLADLAELWSVVADDDALGLPPGAAAAALAERFDHRAKLAGYAGPVLVLHTAGDRLVPPSHAERLHAWAGGADRRLVLFPRGDHNTILGANVAEYVVAVRRFLRDAGVAPPGAA